MLIDSTYFIGEINLPGLQNEVVEESLNSFIQKYESYYLQRSLGYSLMKSFLAGLEADEPEQKWVDLRDGAEFEGCRGLDKWTGFINDGKQSPIANYVYYYFMRDAATLTSGIGEVKPTGENSSNASGAVKMMRAYNQMCEQTALLHEFLLANKDVYTEFDYSHIVLFRPLNLFNI